MHCYLDREAKQKLNEDRHADRDVQATHEYSKRANFYDYCQAYAFTYIYILNRSENATPELIVICFQNYANQECKLKCISIFNDWVMHNSKSFKDVVTRKRMKAI